MSVGWNPWHGCHRVSEGCLHCYVYRIDGKHEKDSSVVTLNGDYRLPITKSHGEWKIASGETVYTCFSSDFLLEDADEWRAGAWMMMKARPDLHFVFFTKRISRLSQCLPPDWGDGYGNVTIGCTCENQARADERLPIFLSLPIRHRMIICEPLLGPVDLQPYLTRGNVETVCVGGESGEDARVCDFEWVKRIQAACKASGVGFSYHQTGAQLLKDGNLYSISRKLQHVQAQKAGLDLP